MISCFVSIPLGVKADLDGRLLDFDFLYYEVIRPAVQELDIECMRFDEFLSGAILQKTLFTAIITSDLMIADVSTHNANVLYELGIRHALKRGRTILISDAGQPLPWNISSLQVAMYELDSSGRLTGDSATKFRKYLQESIRRSQRTTMSDSPIYEFFPDLEVVLPVELEREGRLRYGSLTKVRRDYTQSVLVSPDRAVNELKKSEKEVRGAPEADPVEYITLLRRYRDLSEWDRVIDLANDAPEAVAKSSEVWQMLALALNRRGKPGDQERAIELMEEFIEETGGDSEAFSILGRIYKERYDHAKAQDDTKGAVRNLERAIHYYREGFEKNPKDYYVGLNIATLLLQQNDKAAREELETIVPRVRETLREKAEIGRLDDWELAVDLQLAIVARDWPYAEQAARLVADQTSSRWMLETTIRTVQAIGYTITDIEGRERVEKVLSTVRQAHDQEEQDD